MTPRRSIVAAWLLAVVVLGSSCSSGRLGPDPSSAAGPASRAAVVVEPASGSGPVGSRAAPLEASPEAAEAARATPLTAGAASQPVAPNQPSAVPSAGGAPGAASRALEVAATTSPSCVLVGGVVEVTISTDPGATLGLAAMYADHDAHGAMGFGETDGAGRYVWRLVVPADAPAGEAKAVIGADRPAEDGARRTGHALAPFIVAGVAGCG